MAAAVTVFQMCWNPCYICRSFWWLLVCVVLFPFIWEGAPPKCSYSQQREPLYRKTNLTKRKKKPPKTRVTKKLYIVFKYSKLLNKYKMCSHDLHIGQYTQCPFLILFTSFPLPTQHAKMSYSHLFCFSLLWMDWRSWQLSIGQRPHRRYTWNTLRCRMETGGDDGLGRAENGVRCWWYEQYILTREKWVDIHSQLIPRSAGQFIYFHTEKRRKKTQDCEAFPGATGQEADGLTFSLFHWLVVKQILV